MATRLKNATSPYLLQHADNPVNWWPWSDEAFAAARARDVPVLLSVGYSACHWCHVMAHESFEDPQTAALMNENLVAIKVDREERPDVDSVYMTATQALTGQGGWPMTVFMTPDRDPFFCGTYFPREHFQRLVAGGGQGVAGGPGQRHQPGPGDLRRAGRAGRAARGDRSWTWPVTLRAVPRLCSRNPVTRRSPPWPRATTRPPADSAARPSSRRRWCSNSCCGTPKARGSATASPPRSALGMVTGTAEGMARGGMYDQLAGGFARYSVDAGWVVPHFEKMLYDNALLARVYAHLWRRTGSELARRVARETCAWMLAELGTADGGLASALDADSDGAEGLFYTWTPGELTGVLGAEDAQYAAAEFGVTAAGTFEHGRSVLQRRADPADPARFDRIRAALLAARGQRVRPGRDDKVVAAWNGLAIAALAETGLLLGEPSFIDGARRAAELLARVHFSAGRLARASRDGVASGSAGVLEDYACVAEGLLTLSGVTGEARWLSLAGELLGTALDRFGDGNGGFYDTADDGEALVYRPADPADGPDPVRGLRRGRRPAQLLRAHRVDAPPGGRGGRAGPAAAYRSAFPAGRRVGPGGRRGPDLRTRRDRGRRPGR